MSISAKYRDKFGAETHRPPPPKPAPFAASSTARNPSASCPFSSSSTSATMSSPFASAGAPASSIFAAAPNPFSPTGGALTPSDPADESSNPFLGPSALAPTNSTDEQAADATPTTDNPFLGSTSNSCPFGAKLAGGSSQGPSPFGGKVAYAGHDAQRPGRDQPGAGRKGGWQSSGWQQHDDRWNTRDAPRQDFVRGARQSWNEPHDHSGSRGKGKGKGAPEGGTNAYAMYPRTSEDWNAQNVHVDSR